MATTQTEGKATRGEGPIAVMFADANGKDDYKRVPKAVTYVDVHSKKTNKVERLSVAAIPTDVKDALVAYALANRVKVYIANHAEDNSDHLAMAKQVYNDCLSGKMYSKAEGSRGPGKPFDASIYVEAMDEALKFQAKNKHKRKDGSLVQPMSDAQKANFKTKLETMDGKKRREYIFGLRKSEAFKKAFSLLQAKRITVTSDDEGLSELI